MSLGLGHHIHLGATYVAYWGLVCHHDVEYHPLSARHLPVCHLYVHIWLFITLLSIIYLSWSNYDSSSIHKLISIYLSIYELISVYIYLLSIHQSSIYQSIYYCRSTIYDLPINYYISIKYYYLSNIFHLSVIMNPSLYPMTILMCVYNDIDGDNILTLFLEFVTSGHTRSLAGSWFRSLAHHRPSSWLPSPSLTLCVHLV